jgi:ATP-dependent Clp protease, protease subunit
VADLAGRSVAYFGFTGLLDSNGATRIAAAFNQAVNNSCDEVYLCLSSLGGYVADGIYLYNHIRGLQLRYVRI